MAISVLIWTRESNTQNSIYLQAKLMEEALSRGGFDVEIAHPIKGHFYINLCKLWRAQKLIWHFGSFDLMLLMVLFRRNTIVIYHNITPACYFIMSEPLVAARSILGRLQLRLLPLRWKFAGVSEYNRQELLRFRKSPVSLIPCIVEPGLEKKVEKSIYPSLLYVGRIVENKNCIDLLAEVESAAAKFGQPIHIVIIGSGNRNRQYYNKFTKMVAKMQKQGRVLLEWIEVGVDEMTLDELYSRSWLYVSMSLHEGFGLPICEAIVRGTPAVYLECGGTESVLEGVGAIPIKNAKSFHLSLVALLQSFDDRMSLLLKQQAVLNPILSTNGAEDMVKKLVQLFEEDE